MSDASLALETAVQSAGIQRLQSDIALGRQLQTLKEEGATPFPPQLRSQRISKTRAYALIQLAETTGQWISNGWLNGEDELQQQTADAITAAVQAEVDVQRQVCNAICDGQLITKRRVRQLEIEHLARSCVLLPGAIRRRVAAGQLPANHVATLAGLLNQLSDTEQQVVTCRLRASPEPEDIREAIWTARGLSTISTGALALRALEDCSEECVERAARQAAGLDAVGLLADAIKEAKEVKAAARKLQRHRARLSSVANRLAAECINVPELRIVVEALQLLAAQNGQEEI